MQEYNIAIGLCQYWKHTNNHKLKATPVVGRKAGSSNKMFWQAKPNYTNKERYYTIYAALRLKRENEICLDVWICGHLQCELMWQDNQKASLHQYMYS